MFSPDNHNKEDKESVTMGNRILGFCFAVFLGAILLYLALDVLSAIWGWLLLLASIVAAIWIGIVIYRRRRDDW